MKRSLGRSLVHGTTGAQQTFDLSQTPWTGLPGRTAEKRPGVVEQGSVWGGSPMAVPWVVSGFWSPNLRDQIGQPSRPSCDRDRDHEPGQLAKTLVDQSMVSSQVVLDP